MREIEVKFRIVDAEALLVAFKVRGVDFGDPVFQDDQAYAPDSWRFGDSKLGVSFVRLRTVNGQHVFTLKQPTVNAQACVECESEVTDRAAMHEAIVRMGFSATVRVAKTRRTATVGEVSLCLDQVEGAGTFLELERMVGGDVSPEAVQSELAALVADLGIDAERTEETYDSLVRAAQA